MRLNSSNFDKEIAGNISSKLTKQMDTNILVLSYTTEELLSIKMHAILKREYSTVLACLKKTSDIDKFSVINLKDLDYVEVFLRYKRIAMIIITNEIVVDLEESNEFEEFLLFLDVCKRNKIKIIFIKMKYLFRTKEHKYLIYGMQKSDIFLSATSYISEKILQENNNLVFECSIVYGVYELYEGKDFVKYVYSEIEEWQNNLDDSVEMEPILADEVAMYLCSHMDEIGYHKISCNKNKTTLYKWAAKIIENRKLLENRKDKNLILCDDKRRSEKKLLDKEDFFDLNDGFKTILSQRGCIFNLIYKLEPSKTFLGHNVAKERIYLGETLAKQIDHEIVEKIDFVIPVPRTGLFYAMGLSKAMGVPYMQALIKETNGIRSFQVIDTNVRKEIIKTKILPIRELIIGKNVLIVDEAIFTGTTLKLVSKMLRQCGANEIHIGIPTPECHNQCPFFVQPARSMLLEYIRVGMLEEYFNVDSVTFQNQQVFENMFQSLNGGCMECFMGLKEKR